MLPSQFLNTCLLLLLFSPRSCLTLLQSLELPGTSAYRISRQQYWSGLPFPSPGDLPPGDLPDPGIEPESPALAGRFFTTKPPEKPPCVLHVSIPTIQYEKGWSNNRLMIDICIPQEFLPHLLLGFYFLI